MHAIDPLVDPPLYMDVGGLLPLKSKSALFQLGRRAGGPGRIRRL